MKDDKGWRFIQSDHGFARHCKQAGFKVIPYDTEDGRGPAYEVWATQNEIDQAWSNYWTD